MAGKYELAVLSIAERLEQATHDQVIAAPTLQRVLPLPVHRFIGDMSNLKRLLDGLGIKVNEERAF